VDNPKIFFIFLNAFIMVTGLMTYTSRESSFKAVVVSQREEFKSSRLSSLRERWFSVASCLPKMFCDCLCLPRLKSCLPPHHHICLLALSVQCLRSCAKVLEPSWFCLAFSFLTLLKLLHLLHQLLSHQFAHMFSILLTRTSSFTSFYLIFSLPFSS